MNTVIDRQHQLLCVWSALPMAVLFGGGLAVSGFLPPASPMETANVVSAFYQSHATAILIGQVMLMLAAPLYGTFSVAIGMQMAAIEGKLPILAVVEISMGVITAILLMLPSIVFATAAYRAGRDPALTLMLNDMGWIGFIWTVSAPIVQYLVIAICILRDPRAQPLLPRWLGFYNILFTVMMAGGAVVPLFKSGVFAWNGLLAFWAIVAVFFGWLVLMVSALAKAAAQESIRLQAGWPDTKSSAI